MPNPERIERISVPDETPIVDYLNEDAVHPALTLARQDEFIKWIDKQVGVALQDRKEQVDKWDLYYRMWRGIKGEKNSPWPGASNIVLREVYDHTERSYGKLVDAYLNDESYMLLRGMDREEDAEPARQFDQFMQHEMRDKIKAYFPLAGALHVACRYGLGYVKVYWCEETRQIRERVQVPVLEEFLDPATGQPVADPNTGEPVMVETGEFTSEIQVREETVYKGAKIKCIENPSDVILPVGSTSPQNAKWVVHRCKYTFDEIRRLAYDGIFDVDAVESLDLKTLVGRRNDITGSDDIAKDTRLEAQGLEDSDMDSYDDDELEIYEVQMKYPLFDGAFEEECVFAYVPGSTRLLRGHLNANWDGRRTIYAVRVNHVEGELAGVGYPELIFDLNEMMNTTLNMTIDQTHLALLGMFRVDPQSEAASDDMRAYPGKVWKAAQGEIERLNLGTIQPFAPQMIEFVASLASKYTGVTALSRGLPEENRPVARVTQIRSANLAGYDKVKIRFVGQDLGEVYQGIVSLYQQYGDDDMVYRIVNPDNPAEFSFGSIRREEIRFKPDVYVKSIDAEKAILRENMLQLLPVVMQLGQMPIMQQLAQSGVNLRELVRRLLKDFQVDEVNKIILPDEQVIQAAQAQQQQMEQAAFMGGQDTMLKAMDAEAQAQAATQPAAPAGAAQ